MFPLRAIIRASVALGISPNTLTLIGVLINCAAAWALAVDRFVLAGFIMICANIFDFIDGKVAFITGRQSAFGAFWDSTLDRIGDGAIFGGLLLYFAGPGDDYLYLCLTLYCLVMGSVTSYARARAESLGMDAKGGLAERADRLVAILVLTFFGDVLDLPILYEATLWVLAAASTYTVAFRVLKVRRQARAAADRPE